MEGSRQNLTSRRFTTKFFFTWKRLQTSRMFKVQISRMLKIKRLKHLEMFFDAECSSSSRGLPVPRRALGGGGGLQVGNQVVAVLFLLQAGEDHLGAGDVLLGVGEVHVQRVRAPGDALVLVRLGVGVSRGLAGLPANQAVQVGALLVLAASLNSVALSARLGEDLLSVVGRHFDCLG